VYVPGSDALLLLLLLMLPDMRKVVMVTLDRQCGYHKLGFKCIKCKQAETQLLLFAKQKQHKMQLLG
jgi:hypothetical protein